VPIGCGKWPCRQPLKVAASRLCYDVRAAAPKVGIALSTLFAEDQGGFAAGKRAPFFALETWSVKDGRIAGSSEPSTSHPPATMLGLARVCAGPRSLSRVWHASAGTCSLIHGGLAFPALRHGTSPPSCSRFPNPRHLSGEETARELSQQAVDEEMSDYNGQVAKEKEAQQRRPWHREGVDHAPVRRQRSAGAMTKGVCVRIRA
jgi:hypothetical protein